MENRINESVSFDEIKSAVIGANREDAIDLIEHAGLVAHVVEIVDGWEFDDQLANTQRIKLYLDNNDVVIDAQRG